MVVSKPSLKNHFLPVEGGEGQGKQHNRHRHNKTSSLQNNRDMMLKKLFAVTEWRLLFTGLLFTILSTVLLHNKIDEQHHYHDRNLRLLNNNFEQHEDDGGHASSSSSDHFSSSSITSSVAREASRVEQEILHFFNGEERALQDGVLMMTNNSNNNTVGGPSSFLAERLAERITRCAAAMSEAIDDANKPSSRSEQEECKLKIVFTGSAQTSGRDNFYDETYPFMLEEHLHTVLAQAAGGATPLLHLEVLNHAMDSDVMRDGPQTTHMCIENLVGSNVDVVVWDMDDNMQSKRPSQLEAFLRWTIRLNPAMIVLNRQGPHTRSRRGKKKRVANLGPGHDAVIFEDDLEDMPKPRDNNENYNGSTTWKEQWSGERNDFWLELMEKYSSHVDIAAIDPVGSIYHLDHLEEFSNQAFDADKVLPLVDCGEHHPPPCDQIPKGTLKWLLQNNLTAEEAIPHEQYGKICWAQVGCRHIWYGGKRSHQLRAALNTLPIVRSLQQGAAAAAAGRLSLSEFVADATTKAQQQQQQQEVRVLASSTDASTKQEARLTSTMTLPAPSYCNPAFCGERRPTCITSYVPNLGLDLGEAMVVPTTPKDGGGGSSNGTSAPAPVPPPAIIMPRKGASHFAADPKHQIENINLRFGALGYIDRKYAYHLSAPAPKSNNNNKNQKNKKKKDQEHKDATSVTLSFQMKSPGPIILCEPPSFIDAFHPNRMRPLVDYVELELDGKEIKRPKHMPTVAEVGGPFCKIITMEASGGNHTLRMTTTAVYPKHVMFSQLITFS